MSHRSVGDAGWCGMPDVRAGSCCSARGLPGSPGEAGCDGIRVLLEPRGYRCPNDRAGADRAATMSVRGRRGPGCAAVRSVPGRETTGRWAGYATGRKAADQNPQGRSVESVVADHRNPYSTDAIRASSRSDPASGSSRAGMTGLSRPDLFRGGTDCRRSSVAECPHRSQSNAPRWVCPYGMGPPRSMDRHPGGDRCRWERAGRSPARACQGWAAGRSRPRTGRDWRGRRGCRGHPAYSVHSRRSARAGRKDYRGANR